MKKKFVLTLALVLMVAVGLSAAPFEVDGTFKTGYEFNFGDDNTVDAVNRTVEAEVDTVVNVTGDFWKVSFGGGAMLFDDDMAASADIYIDKALASMGVDMGDLTLTFTIGNKSDRGDLRAYKDSRDDLGDYKLKMDSGFAATSAMSMTVGYGSLVSVMVGADPVSFADETFVGGLDSNNAFIISAMTTPVDGISAAVAYTNVSETGNTGMNESDEGAFSASVDVNIATLAGLNFGLGFSAYEFYMIETEKNNLYLELNGGFGSFSGYTEYRIRGDVQDMILEVKYALSEVLGVGAKVELYDITEEVLANMETKIGAGVEYMMGGVTYRAEIGYAIDAEIFQFTPTVKIAF